jgi:hypothetical protein
MAAHYEKLGVFYLGRRYDLERGRRGDELVLYDSRDLTTHAMIVGMTGSGKTGLGIGLLEEAALDGVPAIAIDPKGDLANLLLQFPGLTPDEFRPWVDASEASRAGKTPEAFAADQAERWRTGLAEWGQDGDRMRRLADAAELAVYTPGSSAGRPLSLLRALAPPPDAIIEDRELFTDRISATVSGLLSLVGITAHPLQDREHILLSTILDTAWRQKEALDLEALVRGIQTPPVTRLGALDLEAIYPAKERLQLGIQINALIAAPGAAQWVEGEPLRVDRLLYTDDGRPRVSVLSIAHLDDKERMFFVSLLLQEVIGWMRSQSGTGSLRALIYMDEVAGYLPPVANPPSKPGFLLLLKQARAFGLGVVLATQNPVDLDYKALSNIGTWFLGRLQTERDKARVMDGLESAQQTGVDGLDRATLDRTLSSLDKRVFLLHNVKADGPVAFETRWTLSYLRGPLTRDHLKRLTPETPRAEAVAARPAAAAAQPAASVVAPPAPAASPGAAAPALASSGPPVLSSGIRQVFLPPDVTKGAPHYRPCVYAAATVRFVDARKGIDAAREVARLVPFGEGVMALDWAGAEETDVSPADLETEPRPDASFDEPPPAAASARTYATAEKDFARTLATGETLSLLSCPALKTTAAADEDERAFRIRLQLAAHEQRDADKDKLRQKYAPKIQKMEERMRRAQEAQAREEQQASHQKLQTALSFGATILGAVLGRKTASVGNVGRAVTAARGVGRSMKEAEDVKRAGEKIEQVEADRQALETELAAAAAELEQQWHPAKLALETVEVKPRKSDVTVRLVALGWRA